jgi:hypothetical protein
MGLGEHKSAGGKGGYVNYIVFAKLSGMRAHTAHDNDPAFKLNSSVTLRTPLTSSASWGRRPQYPRKRGSKETTCVFY